jgi:N-acetylmuramoyl-L-alanine amidase CwlD
MNRLRAKAGNLRAVLVCASVAALPAYAAVPARAASTAPANYWFAGTRLVFERPQVAGTALAVASDDDGMVRFLTKLDATLSFQPGQKYIVITSGDRRTITFTLGDARYTVGGVMQTAAFAPYLSGGTVYLPFMDLARALYVDPLEDGGATVLQPQIASLDVRSESRMTVVTLRGASPLHFKRQSGPSDERVSLLFTGIASTLERDRQIGGAGLRDVTIAVGGTPKNPTTVVTFDAPPGSVHVLAPTDTSNSLALAFAPSGAQLGGTALPAQGDASFALLPLAAPGPVRLAVRPPPPPPIVVQTSDPVVVASPQEAAAIPAAGATAPASYGLQPVTVTAFDTIPTGDGLSVRLSVSGPVTYQWHRLPDNRWYVDLKPATLAVPGQDQTLQNDAVVSLRLKAFVGPNDRQPTVRVALTLASPREVDLVPSDGGLTIAIDRADDPDPQHSGDGQLAGGRIVASATPPPSGLSGNAPMPSQTGEPGPAPTWKFGPPAPGGKLIVIDPGHGGSDSGAMHNGLTEKDINFDISKRLRTILVARGWQVKMTRDSDVDVYAPNDSAHDELQARDDFANNSGARLLISVHSNAFTTSALSGTTTYYFKADSYALADAVHARFVSALPTKDDGVRKENFYVIHHANMPAILIETAFLSNPGDAALLRSAAFLQKIATSIADGVGDYASSNQPLTSTSTGTDGL